MLALYFLAIVTIANSLWIDEYNTHWDSPGCTQWGSLPIGNGNLAANVWLMENMNKTGYDLWIAATLSTSFDITSEWLKTIQLKLMFDPPINNNTNEIFEENLYLTNSTIQIITSIYNISLNIDISNDILYINSILNKNNNNKYKNYSLTSTIISWRKNINFNAGAESNDKFCFNPNFVPIMNDIIDENGCSNNENELLFYHRNHYNSSNYSTQYEYHLKQQLLSEYYNITNDPYYNLTFGGVLSMFNNDNHINKTDDSLISLNIESSLVTFSFLSLQTKSLKDYIQQLCSNSSNILSNNKYESIYNYYSLMLNLNNEWWNSFWNRSWIMISSTYSNETNITYLISLLYNHQRYLDALDGRSKAILPIKFNGQSFWIDTQNGKPDWKDWGAAYWWQNTRQPYYNTLISGDLDLNPNFYNMYYNQLDLIQKRNNVYFNISGGYYSETAMFNGLYQEAEYGWRCGKTFWNSPNTYIKYHWVGGIELVNMLLDDYIWYQNDTIINYYVLPIITVVFNHYLQFFHINKTTNKLYMYPSQSLETWQCPDYPINYTNCVVNPTEQIAGLFTVSKRLLDLPLKFGNQTDRELWTLINNVTPSLPIQNGIIWPGYHLPTKHSNSENTELYTVHPFRMFTFLSNKSDLNLAIETYKKRRFPCNINWCQDILDAAILGLTNDAKQMLIGRAKNGKGPCPWKWYGFYCKTSGDNDVPNHNHIEWMRTAIHYMLIGNNINENSNKIYLFPSWPCEWSVKYKFHTILNTTIHLNYNGHGNITELIVKPSSRMNDIVFVNCVSN